MQRNNKNMSANQLIRIDARLAIWSRVYLPSCWATLCGSDVIRITLQNDALAKLP